MTESVFVERINALEAALRAERAALIGNDVEALLRANQRKLKLLDELESDPPPSALRSRLEVLWQLNRANGTLLSRRRRSIDWALRHIGRAEAMPTYDAKGKTDAVIVGRQIASA